MSRWELSEGWEVKTIGGVAQIDAPGVLPTNEPNRLFQYVGLENIESDTGTFVDLSPTLGSEILSSKFAFSSSHVLYGKLRPYLNKVALPDFEGICSTDILPLLPRKGLILREYLAFYLRTKDFVQYATSHSTGTKMPRVRMPEFRNAEIPLPPLEEQRQIVAILEQVEELRRLRTEADRLSKKILPGAFIEMFGDPRENPKGWETKNLENILEVNQSGTWGQNPREGEKNYPILRSTNMPLGGDLTFEDVAYRYITEETASKYTLAPGDILLNKSSGSKEHIGKICMFRGAPDDQLYLFSNFIQRLRADSKFVLPEYLFFFLISDFAKINLERMHATSSGLRNINMNLYSTQPILVPAIEEQQRFVDLVQELQVHQQRQGEARKILNDLYQSLSALAFTGELTAKWREEQKAILAQRQAVILAMLSSSAQRGVQRVLITSLMKYLFLLQMECRAKELYLFVPYKYGPFAREVYDDLEALKGRGLITVTATDEEEERTEIALGGERGDEITQMVQGLPEGVREDAETVLDLYGELSLKELLDHVYAEYPEYATRSER